MLCVQNKITVYKDFIESISDTGNYIGKESGSRRRLSRPGHCQVIIGNKKKTSEWRCITFQRTQILGESKTEESNDPLEPRAWRYRSVIIWSSGSQQQWSVRGRGYIWLWIHTHMLVLIFSEDMLTIIKIQNVVGIIILFQSQYVSHFQEVYPAQMQSVVNNTRYFRHLLSPPDSRHDSSLTARAMTCKG